MLKIMSYLDTTCQWCFPDVRIRFFRQKSGFSKTLFLKSTTLVKINYKAKANSNIPKSILIKELLLSKHTRDTNHAFKTISNAILCPRSILKNHLAEQN